MQAQYASQYGAGNYGAHVGRPTSKMQLRFSCRKLLDMDLTSKSDPQIYVYRIENNGKEQLMGKTEIIMNNLNPIFVKHVEVNFYFEEVQRFRFAVYDIDKPNAPLKSQDFIGTVETTLSEVVAAGMRLELPLQNPKRKKAGFITIMGEEVLALQQTVHMVVVGNSLDKKDLFGKSDPFLRISKMGRDGKPVAVHKTEVIKKTLNPMWKPFQVELSTLCSGGDPNAPILFECFDWNANGKEDFIGSFTASLSAIQKQRVWPLTNPKKKKKRGYTDSGKITFSSIELRKEHTFMEYLSSGLNMNLMVAVDFTASNGNPKSRNSLHYINKSEQNHYQQAISAVGSILEYYDTDKMIPAYGFGAKVPPNQVVSHCFPLNFSANPELPGVRGVLEAYEKAVDVITLYGPTNFRDIIKTGATIARQYADGSGFLVLLILTDGAISDLQETIYAIVEASSLPMSIIIVGLGKADFSSMDELDADDGPLRARGKVQERDTVQFVPFEKYKDQHPSILAAQTLHELPGQVTSWMKHNGVVPRPRPVGFAPPPQQQYQQQQQQQQQYQQQPQQQWGQPPAGNPYAAPVGGAYQQYAQPPAQQWQQQQQPPQQQWQQPPPGANPYGAPPGQQYGPPQGYRQQPQQWGPPPGQQYGQPPQGYQQYGQPAAPPQQQQQQPQKQPPQKK